MAEKKRKCQKCGVIKPLTEYSREPRIASGYLWKCKECERADDMFYADSVKSRDFRRRVR